MPDLGAYMVTPTGGWVGWAIRQITHSTVNHAAVYVGNGLIVEAEPKGARIARAKNYPKAVWSTTPRPLHVQLAIVHQATDLIGTPYNFLDIAAQALVRVFHFKAPKWALKRISSATRLQCAQLVDIAYERAGVKLFEDGRPEGLVAPSDLLNLIQKD